MTAPETSRLPFENLVVGMQLPKLRRGPVSSAHLMRWSAAIENWHRIHYDQPYGTEIEKLPGLLISGNWKQQLLTEFVTLWLRPDGWLLDIAFEFRKMNVANEVLVAWGTIVELETRGEFGFVTCEIGITNEKGEESTPGRATGVVPLLDGPAVPYPFDIDPEI